ncbi:MAG: thioredoxin-like domain-containing protein [Bacteroidota bacterium]
MKISRLLIAIFVAGILLAGCAKDENRFTVSGKVSHAEGETIYFEKLLVSSTQPLDSVKIDKDGEFEFKGTTNTPSYYLLKLNDNKFITLLIDSLDEVIVTADAVNFERDYHVEGSTGSVQVKELTDHLNSTQKKLDSLQSLHNLYKGNPDYPAMRTQWEEEARKIREEQVEFSTQFVNDNPFSMASVLALYQKFGQQNYVINDLQTMRVAASALNSIYPESEHVKALYQNTVQLLKDDQSARLQQLIQEQGENSPEIILPTPEGEEIALSSLRGKVVLLQFWSALNRDSRILNEALAEAYNKYKNKGFEIYQVSVDDNRIEWVDAIDQDGLTWINVGDMEGSNQAVRNYNVQTVPYNYLLNEEGEIIAKDLKGQALDRALSRLLN